MLLVSCGTDLKFHNCSSYDLLDVYRPADSTGQIRTVSWCKDGSWLALVPSRGNAEIIRTRDDVRLLQTILGVPNPSAAVFQRTTKRNLAMSTVSGSILIYDIKAKGIKKRFVSSGCSVTMLDWCLKDTHLVAGSTDGQVTIYSNTTNQKSSILTVPESKSVSVVRFHTTLRPILGTASDEGVVVVWDINSGREKMCLRPHKAPVTDMVFSSQNSKLMVSVGLDRTFQCYDINEGVVALPVMTDHPLSAVDIAPDGYTVAVASCRGTIYIYDLRHHESPIKTLAAHSGEIKKIMYQPYSLESNSIDLLQITEEKTVETNLAPKFSDASVDSFNILNSVTELSKNAEEMIEQSEEVKNKTNSAAGDSFLNGLEHFDSLKRLTGSFIREKSELSNLGLSDSVRKWLDAKKTSEIQSTSKNGLEIPSANSQNNEKISVSKISSSTPRQQTKDRLTLIKSDDLEGSHISPIVPSVENRAITTEELDTLVQNAVQNVVKQVVKEEVAEQLSELTDSLSRYFLNLQLCFSKQFVGQENHMERLFNYYCGSGANSTQAAQVQQLQQENEFLKSKINELMRKNNS